MIRHPQFWLDALACMTRTTMSSERLSANSPCGPNHVSGNLSRGSSVSIVEHREQAFLAELFAVGAGFGDSIGIEHDRIVGPELDDLLG